MSNNLGLNDDIHWVSSCFSQCVIAVFSVDDEESLECARNMMSYAERYTRDDTFIRIVVGTKIDEERKITREHGEEKAKELNAKYYEVSAKTGEGIQELINDLPPFSEPPKKDNKHDKKCYIQ